jgi:hypothetical protein
MRAWPAFLVAALLLSLVAAPGWSQAQVGGAPIDAPPAPPSPPPPPEPPPGPPLPQPPKPTPWRLAITFGAGSDAGASYFLFGGTVGYQPIDRFELFLDGQYWTGAAPSLGRLAVGANWFPPVDFAPYLGGYFARWFVGGGSPDQDAIGVHAGVSLARTRSAVLLAGVAWEHILACSASCDDWWPELSVGFRF